MKITAWDAQGERAKMLQMGYYRLKNIKASVDQEGHLEGHIRGTEPKCFQKLREDSYEVRELLR